MQKKPTKATSIRLHEDAVTALVEESQRSGKSYTQVIEDFLLWRRLFGDEGEAAVTILASKHNLPRRKVIEFSVLKAAGIGDRLPFSRLAAN